MVTITGLCTRQKRMTTVVSDELAESIKAWRQFYGLDEDQFVDAVTEQGKFELTPELIEDVLSTH